MTEKKLKIPYIKETRKLTEQYACFVWRQLIKTKTFSPGNLRGLVFNYPNTLLLGTQQQLYNALKTGENLKIKPRLRDYVGETNYLLLRLVNEKEIPEIFNDIAEGKKIHIHLVEKISDTENLIIKRPRARGRRYILKTDPSGEMHLTFEIRRQTINDEKNPPTDFLEIMSFLGFYEMTKYLTKLSIEKHDFLPKGGNQRNILLSLINSFLPKVKSWDFKKLQAWAVSSGGFFLEPYKNLDDNKLSVPLHSLEKSLPIEQTALYHDAEKIMKKIKEQGLSTPESIILGNEFTFPLLIGLPLLNDTDLIFLRLSQEANKDGKPLDLLPLSIKKDKLRPQEKNLIERFMYLQFLSRYKGEDRTLQRIRYQIFSKIDSMGIKQRLFKAEEVSLGDPVDYYDFSKLDDGYIHQLKHSPINKSVKNILLKLKRESRSFLNFSYPLGDNTYGLIESLKTVMPDINLNVIFFGKVGATLSWDGQNHIGTRVGRLVIPEYVVSTNDFDSEKFIDKLGEYKIPIPIIFDREIVEEILQSEGVLLQTLMDIKKAQESIIQREDIPYNNRIRLLIDMESWYLNLVCKKFRISPNIIYYTSDNTVLPPIVKYNKAKETIISSLGPRGSFAILISGLTALNVL